MNPDFFFKAYVKYFSEGLSAEYSDKGVVIQVRCFSIQIKENCFIHDEHSFFFFFVVNLQ